MPRKPDISIVLKQMPKEDRGRFFLRYLRLFAKSKYFGNHRKVTHAYKVKKRKTDRDGKAKVRIIRKPSQAQASTSALPTSPQ